MARSFAAVACLLAVSAGTADGGPYDPLLQFQTRRTAHFLIYFHRGEEDAASRLAQIAERVYDALTRHLVHLPAGRTHVVLVHQTDRPNGSTNIVPWNAIEIDAAPPTGADAIGNTDDWLTYVFTHEYSHVLHLDRSRGWARAARAIFGRSVLGFPNLTLPEWQIEGFATLVESEGGQGRLNSGPFREIVDAAARARGLEPIDRVNGGLVDWPAGEGWYAYGGLFHEYLVRHYGADRLVALADRTAGRLPYLTSGAFKAVYGKSLGTLWREFEAARLAGPENVAPPRGPPPTRLTHHGFSVRTPRVDADGNVWFSGSDPHRFPQLYRLRPGASAPDRVAERYGGTGLTMGRDVVVFDQLEVARGAGLPGDLYALDRHRGSVRRLTRDARLAEPDLSPDGRRLAVIRTRPAARELLILDAAPLLNTARPLSSAALSIVARLGGPLDVFATPRWSPDGSRLAVEHRAVGGPSEILVLGADLSPTGPAISSPRGRNVTPEWTADSQGLYFASDRDGGPFELFRATWSRGAEAIDIERLVAPDGGALSPARTPDGGLVYVGYTTAGYDLFVAHPERIEGPEPAERPQPVEGRTAPFDPTVRPEPVEGRTDSYRPWSTLWPRGWLPVIEQRDNRWRLGGAVFGTDVLGRHALSASATWAIINGASASASVPASRPDWQASYVYRRWQTAPFASAQDQTALFDVLGPTGDLVTVAQHDQQIDAGAVRSFQRVRWSQSIVGAVHVDRLTTETASGTQAVDRAGVRGAWLLATAREYGYSISPEGGVFAALTAEAIGETSGSSLAAHDVTGDLRAYLPLGIPHAVLAVRAAGGVSRGDPGVRRVFRLGGDNGNPAIGSFSDDAVSVLRGFGSGVFIGTHVALTNLEARLPIAWPQRGVGTWPMFLRAVHATAFADIGNAWTTRTKWSDRKVGVGGELSTDVTLAFGLSVTWTAGIAWGHDGSGQLPNQHSVYFRVGQSF